MSNGTQVLNEDHITKPARIRGGVVDESETSVAKLQAKIAELEGRLATRNQATVSFRVSDKGACSVYGLGRFPVTLYASQWARLFAVREELEAYLKTNWHKLAHKES